MTVIPSHGPVGDGVAVHALNVTSFCTASCQVSWEARVLYHRDSHDLEENRYGRRWS